MPILRIQEFSGAIPVKGDRALGDNFSVEAFNTWLYGSELRGLRAPKKLLDINISSRRVFRIPKRTVGGDPAFPTYVPPPSYLGDSVWMQFDDHDTDIVKGQLIEDQYERYYFCSPTRGPEFNTYARMKAGQTPYKLGVPGPSNDYDASGANPNKPTIVSITGGAVPVTDSAYCYTWVNEFGEESSPSLPVLGAGNANATWTIGNIKDPPSLGVNYPAYTKKYLYRTLSGGVGNFYRVNTVAIGTLTYADNRTTITDEVITNNLPLESIFWAPPPANLQGWVAMPNGFLIAFDKPVDDTTAPPNGPLKVKGNNIYMCEPYHFHAWPPQYKYATETPVVGLGVVGQTCVVCTQGYPTTVTGIKPATCSFTKVTTGEPCLSRGSIVSTPQGVIYASQNGLVSAGPAGFINVTESLITRDEWLKNFAPQYLRAVRYQNGYLALRMFPIGSVPPRSGFYLDPSALKVALTELSDFDAVVALNNDFWSGEAFLLKAGEIFRWDSPPDLPPATQNNYMATRWLSKEFQFPYHENFGAFAVHFDPARLSIDPWSTSVLPVDQTVRFKVYADRIKVYDEIVRVAGEGQRLLSGFKADIWQFEVVARAPVYSLHVASTMKELKAA